MRELREVLNEAFERHARALDAAKGHEASPDVVTDIRRHRGLRSAAVAVGSVAAIGALVAVAVAVPTLRDGSSVAAPASPVAGAPAWCNLDSHPSPNIEAFGPAQFDGRVWADYENEKFFFTHPDGTVEELVPDGDGVVSFQMPGGGKHYVWDPEGKVAPAASGWSALVIDYSGAGAGGTAYLEDGINPQLGYEWTTVAPADVPAGVSAKLLAEVHTLTLGFTGTGLEPNVAGADAVVESVIRWKDGSEEVVRIGRGQPGATIRDYEGLESASIRATLPNGETYEITSYYDASKTYAAACAGEPVPVAAQGADSEPTPAVDPYNYGPYLEGPESALFACNALLPEGLDAQPLALEYRQGLFYDVNEFGVEFDFGTDGFALTAPDPTYPNPVVPEPAYPGWGSHWSDDSGERLGSVIFAALVWVDGEDQIVARQVHQDPREDTSRVETNDHPLATAYDSDDRVTWYVGDATKLAVPCDGVDAATVADASLVFVHGYGPSANAMEWAIYRP